ncbi:MAG: 1-(5-phosphoribosyl)-5-[(5-phosphoribosylamino)methylideneamino] imidazole-4-carboxamide isomerase [Bacteroides sp. SM23_62_1]|nr:MAG: 1-(5-phosphoribosyl)-5-[(5-phosphoribosylamino)methylideneamino] imidazole-4-carboxamide isomerase [Bacteroides sp. SM23_62_1]
MIEIIPSIDILDGRCVRLERGDFRRQTIFYDDPLEMALFIHDHGLKRLHLVDLDGAKKGKIVNHSILEKISGKTGLIIDFGGGIKQDSDVEIAFRSGATMITVGTVAARDPARVVRWLQLYGPEKIILGADVRNGKITVNAWRDLTVYDIFDFINQYKMAGIHHVMCTDINRDGMMQGPSINLYRQLRSRFNDIRLIASGGIAVLSDIENLDKIGMDGAIIGRALYEQTITFDDLKKFLI